MGWLITLGILTLLAVLPLGIHLNYDAGGAVGKLVAGPLRIRLFPKPKKEKKEKKPKKGKKKETPQTSEPPPGEKTAAAKPAGKKPGEEKAKGGPITDFLPLVKVALDFLNGFRRKLRVNRLELKLVMAGGDPCDLAVNYGRAWAALGNLMPNLERFLVIKKRNIEIECDFVADATLVTARVEITITLGRLLGLVTVTGVKALRKLLPILKKRKGGASK